MKMVTAERRTTLEHKKVLKEYLFFYTTESWICLFGVALIRKNIYVMIMNERSLR